MGKCVEVLGTGYKVFHSTERFTISHFDIIEKTITMFSFSGWSSRYRTGQPLTFQRSKAARPSKQLSAWDSSDVLTFLRHLFALDITVSDNYWILLEWDWQHFWPILAGASLSSSLGASKAFQIQHCRTRCTTGMCPLPRHPGSWPWGKGLGFSSFLVKSGECVREKNLRKGHTTQQKQQLVPEWSWNIFTLSTLRTHVMARPDIILRGKKKRSVYAENIATDLRLLVTSCLSKEL